MKRFVLDWSLLVVAVAVGLFALCSQLTGRSAGQCSVPPDALALDGEELAFLQLLNQYRAQNGAPPVTASVNLDKAAQWMATDSGQRGWTSHYSADGRSPWQRMADCGYPYAGGGENMAWGQPQLTAQGVFSAWKSSAGHDANMLNPEWRQVGIGRYVGGPLGVMWVTDFASRDDGTRATGAQATATASPTRPPATPTAPAPTSTAPATPTALPSPTPRPPSCCCQPAQG